MEVVDDFLKVRKGEGGKYIGLAFRVIGDVPRMDVYLRGEFLHGLDEHELIFVSLHYKLLQQICQLIKIIYQAATNVLSFQSWYELVCFLLDLILIPTIITIMQGKENANPNHPYLYHSKFNKDTRLAQPLKQRLTCLRHNEEIGKYFCIDCLSYNICAKCCGQHDPHEIREYKNAAQAKEETKEVLLIEVESTLNRLKGRENELKNGVEEISLIKNRLKSLSDEIITAVKAQLQQLEEKIQEKLKVEFDKYEKELDCFYREYNNVNDYLRESLLKIIDGEVDIAIFSRREVSMELDGRMMPQFGKIKMVMEKCKRYLKNVKESTKELENSIRFFSNEEEKTQMKFEKYDRFLKEKPYSECNAPLLRTLDGLHNHHPDLASLARKLRT